MLTSTLLWVSVLAGLGIADNKYSSTKFAQYALAATF